MPPDRILPPEAEAFAPGKTTETVSAEYLPLLAEFARDPYGQALLESSQGMIRQIESRLVHNPSKGWAARACEIIGLLLREAAEHENWLESGEVDPLLIRALAAAVGIDWEAVCKKSLDEDVPTTLSLERSGRILERLATLRESRVPPGAGV